MAVILGDAALYTDEDRLYAKFAEAFEEKLRVSQGYDDQPLDRGDA